MLDSGTALFQWNGASSHKKERTRALDLCRAVCAARAHNEGVTVEHVLVGAGASADGSEGDTRFWHVIGGEIESCAPS